MRISDWSSDVCSSDLADALDAAIAATFARRSTEVPANRPLGLSEDMAADPAARRRWLAYSASLELTGVDFGEVLDDAWNLLGPSCERLNNRADRKSVV